MFRIKTKIKQVLRTLGMYQTWYRKITHSFRSSVFSAFDEELIAKNLVQSSIIEHRFYVDIGASNGVGWSNSCSLALSGWSGLAIEANPNLFSELAAEYAALPKVALARHFVNPGNVTDLLRGYEVPENFGFLSLDIDSYDYFVLEEILKNFRPSILCCEINERIPPPIRFTELWNPKDVGFSSDKRGCFGMSISQLDVLAKRYGYGFVALEFNNAFLAPLGNPKLNYLTPEQAFSAGFLNRPDRKKRYRWGRDMEEVYSMTPPEAVNYLNQKFESMRGRYQCEI